MTHLPVIALTPGEPAGVGPDVCIALCRTKPDCALVIIADPAVLSARAAALGRTWQATPWHGERPVTAGLYIDAVAAAHPAKAGKLDPANSPYVLRTLERAVDGCLRGTFDALVTGPVHKGIINDAGLPFTGHTEFLAERSGVTQPVMLLAAPDVRFNRSRHPTSAINPDVARLPPSAERPHDAGDLQKISPLPLAGGEGEGEGVARDWVQASSTPMRVGRSRRPVSRGTSASMRVALVTTHLPLAEVPKAITRERLTAVLRVLHHGLQTRFRIAQPRILVCGLNPHAGEGGHLGREEIDVIEPVLARLRAEGMALRGPVPADTAFLPDRLAETDAVLTMYHDQGLPVLKHHDFAHAVNVTLGLPFVRTSVDHGTALELAGTGRADSSSLKAALDMAIELCAR